MKYKLILTNRAGDFRGLKTCDSLIEAEKIGYNYTNLEKMIYNEIPNNNRYFRVYEITPNFNILECI